MSSSNESLAIGIDLGTTNCCIAFLTDDGTTEIIANGDGERTTPSYVAHIGGEILVGKIAKEESFIIPENVVYDSKRLIGRPFNDTYLQNDIKNWTFKVISQNNKPIIELPLEHKLVHYKPQEISAKLLGYMKSIAEDYLGSNVKDAIITVPAHFNYHQRTATVEAGKLAGLNILGTINEPTAAALAYIHKNKITGPKTIMIFDLGGGTLDTSIVKIKTGSVTVIATAGNTHLGGRDFDNNLIELINTKVKNMYGKDSLTYKTAERRIRSNSEQLKIRLSSRETVTFEMEYLGNDIDAYLKITRKEFEEINLDLFKSAIDLVQNCITNANLNKTDIDEIILVGGSVRIPKIQQMLSDFFNGKFLSKAINPDEAIAYGAAVQASKFRKNSKTEALRQLHVFDITSLAFGVNVQGDLMDFLIPRNSKIPAKVKHSYVTSSDKDMAITWNIYEGERQLVSDNIHLGTCTLNFPPKPLFYSVELIFNIDENGILYVSAEEKSGKHTSLSIEYKEKDHKCVSDIVHDAQINKHKDEKKVDLIKKLTNLRDYCRKVKAVCDYDRKNMPLEDKDQIKNIATKFDEWATARLPTIHQEGDTLVNRKIKEIEEICEPILAKYKYDVKNMDYYEFHNFLAENI